MDNKKIVLVVAGNYAEFNDWCTEEWLKELVDVGIFDLNYEHPNVEYVFVSNPESIRGLRNVIMVKKIGTWYKRTDINWVNIYILLI